MSSNVPICRSPRAFVAMLAILSVSVAGLVGAGRAAASIGPSATAMTVPANGTYGSGQAMLFTVTFSAPMYVDTIGGTPRIPITLDTPGTVYADYVSGSGTDTLTFQYMPTPGAQDLTGIVTATAIDANGATIRDSIGDDAQLALNAVEPSTAGIDVDAVIPVVTSVGVPANATYIAGQDLDVTVNLSKNVIVDTTGGTPSIRLMLDGGETVAAQYISGSATSTLVFAYVIANGDAASDGITLGSAIALDGATINDAHANRVDTTLHGVAATNGVLVDAVAPTVGSIARAGASPTNSSAVSFTVSFSEPVTGVDAADFTLTGTGSAAGTIASVAGVSASVYEVTVNGVTGDGTLRLDLNGSGTGIADLATNPIQSGFTGAEVYTVLHSAPVVTAATVPADGTYAAGKNLDFTVAFNRPVTVTGTPRIPITLATGSADATYLSGSGTGALAFRYAVASVTPSTAGIDVDGRAAQSIQFPAIAVVYGHADFGPASASSGLPVAYSAAAGACSIDQAGLVAISAAGTCTVTAGQAGNSHFVPAAPVTQSFTVAKAAQTIAFHSAAPQTPVIGAAYTVSATTGTGLPVEFSIDPSSTPGACSIAGAVVAFRRAGSCVVDADQPGNGNYLTAPRATQTVTIVKPGPPTNRLVSARLRPRSNGTIQVSLDVPGPGTVDVLVTAWNDNVAIASSLLQPARHRFTFARAHGRARHSGTLQIDVRPNARGRRLVLHHTYRVTLRLWVTYRPAGGKARSSGYRGVHLPDRTAQTVVARRQLP